MSIGRSRQRTTNYAKCTLVELDPTVDFIAGTTAGTGGLVVGFPFDTDKLQTPELSAHYNGSTARAIATIVRKEHVLGLYKGIASHL
ncbi:hypothetical protein MKEN_00864600 [Mycena kentingensis (nom. inval.)]|nr:hypothetical protein MKEN_00864600 [Mycena kentingensis (nom. inval.)]